MAKRRKSKKEEDREEKKKPVKKDPKSKIKFHVALIALLGSFTVLTLISLVMVLILNFLLSATILAIILLFILVPLLSGFFAGRYLIKRDTWLLGLMGGIIWSSIEIGIFLLILFNIKTVMPPKIWGVWEILILVTVVITNCLFCLFGLRISAKPNALLQIKSTGE